MSVFRVSKIDVTDGFRSNSEICPFVHSSLTSIFQVEQHAGSEDAEKRRIAEFIGDIRQKDARRL